MIHSLLVESGIEVCEVGSNYGSTLIKMAQLYPRSNFTGLDICEEVCVEAQKRAEKLSLTNITFQVCANGNIFLNGNI